MIVISMNDKEDLEIIKQLAKEIANNKNRWLIMKEINDMIDFEYDWIHFNSILAMYRVLNTENYPKYSKIFKKLENRELLKTLRKYVLEFVFNKS